MDGSDGLGAEGWVEREDGGEVSGFSGEMVDSTKVEGRDPVSNQAAVTYVVHAVQYDSYHSHLHI